MYKVVQQWSTFYQVNNSSSYNQIGFVVVPQKDSCYVLNDIDAFFLFLFLLQKDFDFCIKPFFVFFLFLLQKYFDIFHVLLFRAFLCVSDNSYLPFLLYRKKNYKKYFYSHSIINFLHQIFLHQNFFCQSLLYQNHHKNFLYQQ